MKSLQDKNVLVLGLGLSGLAQARWCARFGARVTVADTRQAPPQLGALQAELPEVRFVSGAFTADLVKGQDAVFTSPGLSPAEVAPVVEAARAAGLACGNELTLFAQALQALAQVSEAAGAMSPGGASESSDRPDAVSLVSADAQAVPGGEDLEEDELLTPMAPPPPPEPGYRPKVLAVTGTNGKTTVTSLTGLLVARTGKRVAVAGNIGPTLLDTLAAALDQEALPEVWVLELSSFQLHQVSDFEPTAATVLNLSQDHLDWHGDMQAYAEAKAHIYGQQGLMVLNRDDPQVMAQLPAPVAVKGKPRAPHVRAHQTFGLDIPTRPGDWGLETVNGMTWLVRAAEADETIKRKRDEAQEIFIQRLMPVDALRIRGRHNASNALAALALASAAGCAMAPMLHGLREYRGEPHRVEPVMVVDGVEFFDDSKGTNVGATVAALNGLGAERRVVVILGGEGKGQDFSPLAGPISRVARGVVLIGRDAPVIGQALQDTGVVLEHAPSMVAAVRAAFDLAQAGDAVLLSPACASFDMFDNYEHRARAFTQAVTDLAHEQGVML